MQESNLPLTTTAAATTLLESAIAQAVLQHEQEQAEQATAAQAERQAVEQKAIACFRLPFDDNTLNVLPVLNFRFEDGTQALKPIAWFTYQGLIIEVNETARSDAHQSWALNATRNDTLLLTKQLYVYPRNWSGYKTPKQLGQAFLVFLHEATSMPTPTLVPAETGHFVNYVAHKYREAFIKTTMQGTLMGLTNTGVAAGACLQTALFAIETAEQVLALMDATPLQRKVLSVLDLERFTHWLNRLSPLAVVGNLADYYDHPVCHYVQQACGVSLSFSSLSLNDKSGTCVLGNDSTALVPHELPLNVAGEWLPALLSWQEADPETQADCPTFTAGEVLAFLTPFQS